MVQPSKRALRRLAAVVLAPLAALTLFAAPASAATSGFSSVSSWQHCPAGWFCAWENADATGHWARFQDGSSDLTKAINGYVFNDKFQYAYNRTNNGSRTKRHLHSVACGTCPRTPDLRSPGSGT